VVDIIKRKEEPISPAGVGRPDYSASLVISGGNTMSIDLVDVIDVIPPGTYVDVLIYAYINPDHSLYVPKGVYDTWTYMHVSHESNQLFGAFLEYLDTETGTYTAYMGGLGYGSVTVNIVNDTRTLKEGDVIFLRIFNLGTYPMEQVMFNLSGKRSLATTNIQDIRKFGGVV